MSWRAKIPLFVGVALLWSGCSSKPRAIPRHYGEPIRHESSSMRDTPQIHKATMRPYQIAGKWYYPSLVEVGETSRGIASWYGPKFHGKKTSNGEIYSMYAHTAAHKTFPMNTMVRVTNRENGRSTVVRINDRGPFVEGRIIDLSNTAAREIDMVAKGTAPVVLEVIGFGGVISKEKAKNLPALALGSKEFKVGKVEESVQVGRFLVQIGAFRNREGAERFRRAHSEVRGYKAVVRSFELEGKPIYRVMLSGFKGEEEARDFIASESSVHGAFIIAE